MPSTSEDRDAIRDLYARYCHHVDGGVADAWAALFTDDAVFSTGAGEPIAGRDALRAFAAGLPTGTMHHLVTDLAIDVMGDTATCTSSVLVLVDGAIVSNGRSVDALHRADGGWRISRRTYTPYPRTA